jgi:hypothetical protein
LLAEEAAGLEQIEAALDPGLRERVVDFPGDADTADTSQDGDVGIRWPARCAFPCL